MLEVVGATKFVVVVLLDVVLLDVVLLEIVVDVLCCV